MVKIIIENQPSLFDAKLGNSLRDEALQQVEENADEEWKVKAMKAIRHIAETMAEFTPDEVWKYVPKPREPRALGAMMRRARVNQWIVPTKAWEPSKIPTQHSRPIQVWKSLLISQPIATFDRGGYPTEESLEIIKKWSANDLKGLMEFVHKAWYYENFIWMEGEVWHVATGGWSGNEEIIGAMAENTIWWMMWWESSTRGGKFTFCKCGGSAQKSNKRGHS